MNIIKNDFTFKQMNKLNPNKVLLVVFHHRGGNGDVQSIHQQHLKQGWAGIGYHYYIRKDGTVYQGRPIQYVGSHCKGNNNCAIGVCLEGNFSKEQPTQKQLNSCVEIYKWIKRMYPRVYKAVNHKDLFPTACPCYPLAEYVNQHRS